MKRFKVFAVAVTLLAMFAAIPAQAVLQDMSAAVYKWEGGIGADGKLVLTQITSGITFKVLATGSDTPETLFYPGKTTSLTNPVTTTNFASTSVCNKKVAFRVDPTDATSDRYVDLIVTHATGAYTLYYPNFDRYTHTLVIDERPNVLHQGTLWFSCTTAYPFAFSAAAEISTGVAFVADTFVQDVRVDVVTTLSAATFATGLLSTGPGGKQTGFRTGMLLTTAGFVKDTGVVTDGTSLDYTAASTYGSLLYTAITGVDSPWNNASTLGGRSYIGHVVTGSNTGTITYSCSSTAGGTTADPNPAGYIHYWFSRVR